MLKPMTQEDLRNNVVGTYFTLRGRIVVLSVALPLVPYFCNTDGVTMAHVFC